LELTIKIIICTVKVILLGQSPLQTLVIQ